MQHTLQLDAVRHVVLRTFADFTSPSSELFETVLIRDGFYCGRSFTCDDVRAVWFAEENVVKFYGSDGQFLQARGVSDRPEADRQQRAA